MMAANLARVLDKDRGEYVLPVMANGNVNVS